MLNMNKLPEFTDAGLLSPGDYELTLSVLEQSLLVGESVGTWDASWRLDLVRNLGVLVRQLWSVGITEILGIIKIVREVTHD